MRKISDGGILQHLAVPSWEAVMQRVPSAVIATSTTQPLWPARLAVQRPVKTSQTRAVKSSPAVMARRASGDSATAQTPAAFGAGQSTMGPPPSSMTEVEVQDGNKENKARYTLLLDQIW